MRAPSRLPPDLASSPPDATTVRRYNPYDATWIPSGWFADGLVADMHYYFGDVPKSTLSPTAAAAHAPPPPQPTGA